MEICFLPKVWEKRILHSLRGINDGKKCTPQLQIYVNLISFRNHCKDCGRLYNDIKEAFYDCPALKILREHCGLRGGISGSVHLIR
ncbi:Uncharacterized protein FKW44_002597, partial [Caligus rogercresseyi]